MKVSFIGTNTETVCVASHLKKCGFDVVSICGDDLKDALDAAIAVNCKARTSLSRTLNESDVIFVTTHEENTKTVLYNIYKLKPKNKIFCILSEIETSDIIDFDDDNTFFSFAVMKKFIKNSDSDLKNVPAIIEGRGPRYWEFLDELDEKEILYKVIKKQEKYAYTLACEMATELVNAVISTADDILENAGITDKSFLKNIVIENAEYYFKSPKELSFFNTPISNGKVASIDNHLDALDKYGDSQAKLLYKIIAFNIIDHSDLKSLERERIKKIILGRK